MSYVHFIWAWFLGLRELLGASPELISVEGHARKRLNKEVKKALETADTMLEVESPISMKSPKESAMLESHEEFYDAIMADDPDEEEDECDADGLITKHQVFLLLVILLQGDDGKILNAADARDHSEHMRAYLLH